jgi:endoglucanase
MKLPAGTFATTVALALAAAACGESTTKGTEGSGGALAVAAGGSGPVSAGKESPRSDVPSGAQVSRASAGTAGLDRGVHAGAEAGSSGTLSAGASGQSGIGASSGSGGNASAAGSAAHGGDPGSGGAGSGGTAGSNSSVDASAMAKEMGFGANIGNTLENTTTWETGWGQPLITQAFINGMSSHGIKTVRVPVAWDTYASSGVIDAAKLNRVKEVVSWIEAAGMYSIVNIHWDGGWIFNENKPDAYKLTSEVKTKFANYWKQIATGFSGVGHKLILEGLNEEGRFYVNGDSNGTPDIAALNELNQLFVTTVRAQGGYNATRALLIAGFNTDIAKTCVDAFSVPTDPAGAGKLFLSIHFYDPYTFTLMEDAASWGSPQATWGTDTEKKTLQDMFGQLGTFSTSKKIPVILGEFAVTRGMKVMRQPAARVLWMQSVTTATTSRGMVPVLWDTGTEISRSDGALSSELQIVVNTVK